MKYVVHKVVAALSLLAATVGCSDVHQGSPVEPPIAPNAYTACSDGSITFTTTIRAGADPYNALEQDGTLFTGCGYMILTGVGGRINHDSYWAGLVLKGRLVNADGTLGPQGERYFGDLGAGPEKSAEVPPGHAVIGIGIGQEGTHDLKTIVLKHRAVQVVNGQLQLVGPVGTTIAGSGKLDSEAFYELTGDTQVLVGAGFRSAIQRTKTLAFHVGVLQ